MEDADKSMKRPEKMYFAKVADPVSAQGKISSRKRKLADDHLFQTKVSIIPYENEVSQLQHLKPGLVYNVEPVSILKCSVFEASVLVDNQKFIGHGNSKQLAKQAAAQAALASLEQFVNIPIKNEEGNFSKCEIQKNAEDVLISLDQSVFRNIPATVPGEDVETNAILLLNTIFPDLIFAFKEDRSVIYSKRCSMSVDVLGKKYVGTGPNKKLAKIAAAHAVLSSFYKIPYDFNSQALNPNFPQTVADQIETMLMSTFTNIMIGNIKYDKWKAIAGIAMTKDRQMRDVQIITIGTGTKCINSEYVSMDGTNLNDCHAEVISRRCLKDFFYTNLELLLKGEADKSIFVWRKKGGYGLKPHIKFHLYINTAPCGDARIFTFYQSIIKAIDNHPNCNTCGVLRTKIQSGDGSVPVEWKGAVQASDIILPCEKHCLTMSCSDKIASWNVLGLQGSLLSFFIEPIYLHSVILGRVFRLNHLQRALFGRFERHLKNLPKRFNLNKPKIIVTTSPKKRHLPKSPNFSINWTAGLAHAEVVNATTGKTESGQVSRLSKRSFFQRFLDIYDRLSCIDTYEIPYPPLYVLYKNSVTNYQEAQKALNSAFVDAELGCWVKKPIEQQEFIV